MRGILLFIRSRVFAQCPMCDLLFTFQFKLEDSLCYRTRSDRFVFICVGVWELSVFVGYEGRGVFVCACTCMCVCLCVGLSVCEHLYYCVTDKAHSACSNLLLNIKGIV